jgi:hypothetical protein
MAPPRPRVGAINSPPRHQEVATNKQAREKAEKTIDFENILMVDLPLPEFLLL